MLTIRTISSVILATLMIGTAVMPAGATSNYTYKKGEFALIDQGQSPDRQWSIRSHGDGAIGDENFKVLLFREPGAKRIGPLEEIQPLDTAPSAIHAHWAPGSTTPIVAVEYRTDRHVIETSAYVLANNRAYPITGPSVFQAALKIPQEPLDERKHASWDQWTWRDATHFTIKAFRQFKQGNADLAKRFPDYARSEELSADEVIVSVSIEADCEFVAPSGYRILKTRPGVFQDQ